jgi:hypothetical protein
MRGTQHVIKVMLSPERSKPFIDIQPDQDAIEMHVDEPILTVDKEREIGGREGMTALLLAGLVHPSRLSGYLQSTTSQLPPSPTHAESAAFYPNSVFSIIYIFYPVSHRSC